MNIRGRLPSIQLYVAALVVAGGSVVVLAAAGLRSEADLWVWVGLCALFGITESKLLYFHHKQGRQSLSASEAILLPLLFALSWSQVTVGIAIVIVATRPLQRSEGLLKAAFNVAQITLAASAAAYLTDWLSQGSSFTFTTASASVAGVVLYATINHALVSGAIALAESSSFKVLISGVATATLWNLGLSVSLGLLFAATYSVGAWTISLFVLPLAALFAGYRAILRQEAERERIEKLHDATRALASGSSVDEAVGAFLVAVGKIVSAREVVLLVNFNDEIQVTRVAEGVATAVMEPTEDVALIDFTEHLERTDRPIIVAEGENSPWRNWADDLRAKSLVATPLQDESLGCLIAMDRVGAGEFSDDDAKLLEALAQELVLSLGSYRLFAQVSQERERFGRIFSGSKDGICLLDDDGRVLAWNPALERITGYSQSEVVGRELSDSLLIRDASKQRLDTWAFVGADPDAELEIVTRDGPGRYVSVLSGSVSRGKETSWVLLVRDRTAEHQAEQSKSDFLSTISHELRTPLTSIKGSLQVLARGQEALPDGVHSQMVEVLQRSSDRLERLLLNLLFVSRVETDGQLSLVTQQVDVEPILRDAVRSILGGRDNVELDIEPGLDATVTAEHEGLTQAIEHLLDNARKFSPQGKIAVSLRRASRFAEVVVADEGPGIPKAEHDRIFERFVRLGETLTRETQGPGVGLFIVRSVAASIGGRVWVESEPGEGSSFHLLVPLARQLRVAPQPAAGAS